MKIKTFFALTLAFLIQPSALYADTQSLAALSRAAVETILELRISEEGQSELKFGNVLPSLTQQTSTGPMIINLRVNSNIGERYQVTQSLSGPLENQDGAKIDAEFLKFTTSSGNANASVKSSPEPVSTTTQTIYISDDKGTSDSIKAEYNLTVPANQAPGDYSALITYTVSSV